MEIIDKANDDDSDEDQLQDNEFIIASEEVHSDDENNEVQTPPVITSKALSDRHALEFTMIVVGGTMLAFNAGFVNGITYLAAGMPVSHITGTTTKSGIFLAKEDNNDFLVLIAVIICFIFGSIITGTIISHDSFHLGRQYGPLFIIGSALFLAACLVAHFSPESNVYFYFAAIACGLQNSLTTRYSGSVVRTTHLTGAGTDIGLVIGRCIIGDYKERWKLKVLVPIFLSFLFGGFMSVHFFQIMGKLALLLNVLFFFSTGVLYSIIVGREMHIPFWKALFGSYEKIEYHIKKGKTKAGQAIKKLVRRIRRKKSVHQDTNINQNKRKISHEKELKLNHKQPLLRKQKQKRVEANLKSNEDENNELEIL